MLLAFPVGPAATEQAEWGHHLSSKSLQRIFGNRNLWLIDLPNLGAYGAYFTIMQLLPAYAQQHLGIKPESAALLDTLVLLCGIPGSFIGGWLADKLIGAILTFLGAFVSINILSALIPFAGASSMQWIAALIGSIAILGTAGWLSLSGLYISDLELSDIPTAAGLMMSIAAIGGVIIPLLYGHIAVKHGYLMAWECTAVIVLITAVSGIFIQSPGSRQRLNQFKPGQDKAESLKSEITDAI